MDGSERGLISCRFFFEPPTHPLLLEVLQVYFYSSRGGFLEDENQPWGKSFAGHSDG